jgi:hypothetical protein
MESFKLTYVGVQPDGRLVFVCASPYGDIVVSVPNAFGRDDEVGLTRTIIPAKELS